MSADVVGILFTLHPSLLFSAANLEEHEVAASNALRSISCLSPKPDENERVGKLRCTRMKARVFLHRVALRERYSAEDTDEEPKRVFPSARIARDCDLFLIEVPRPLAMDRLQSYVCSLGYLSDGSSFGSIAKVSERAFLALLFDIADNESKNAVGEQFAHQRLTDTTFTGVARDVLKRCAGQAASSAVDNLEPILHGSPKDFVAGLTSLIESVGPNRGLSVVFG